MNKVIRCILMGAAISCLSGYAAPTRVVSLAGVMSTSASITFSWTEPSPSEGYTVLTNDVRFSTEPITVLNFSRATNISAWVGNIPVTAPGSRQTVTINGLQTNTDYYVAMKSQDSSGTSWSRLSNVAVVRTTANNTSVMLAWNPSPDSDVTSYRLYYGLASGNYNQSVDTGNVTSYTITDLVLGVTYYFTCKAVNSAGLESDPCNEITFTPL